MSCLQWCQWTWRLQVRTAKKYTVRSRSRRFPDLPLASSSGGYWLEATLASSSIRKLQSVTFALWVMYCRGAAFSEFFLESVPSPTPWLYFCKYLTFPCEQLIESTHELLNCSLLPLHYSSLLFPKHLFMQENKLHVVPLENPRTFHHRGLHSDALPGCVLTTHEHPHRARNMTAKMTSTFLVANVSPPTRSIYFDKKVLCYSDSN